MANFDSFGLIEANFCKFWPIELLRGDTQNRDKMRVNLVVFFHFSQSWEFFAELKNSAKVQNRYPWLSAPAPATNIHLDSIPPFVQSWQAQVQKSGRNIIQRLCICWTLRWCEFHHQKVSLVTIVNTNWNLDLTGYLLRQLFPKPNLIITQRIVLHAANIYWNVWNFPLPSNLCNINTSFHLWLWETSPVIVHTCFSVSIRTNNFYEVVRKNPIKNYEKITKPFYSDNVFRFKLR